MCRESRRSSCSWCVARGWRLRATSVANGRPGPIARSPRQEGLSPRLPRAQLFPPSQSPSKRNRRLHDRPHAAGERGHMRNRQSMPPAGEERTCFGDAVRAEPNTVPVEMSRESEDSNISAEEPTVGLTMDPASTAVGTKKTRPLKQLPRKRLAQRSPGAETTTTPPPQRPSWMSLDEQERLSPAGLDFGVAC